jgi:hypothetical protein
MKYVDEVKEDDPIYQTLKTRLSKISEAVESGGLEREVMHDLIQVGLEMQQYQQPDDYLVALQKALPITLGFGLRKIGHQKVR